MSRMEEKMAARAAGPVFKTESLKDLADRSGGSDDTKQTRRDVRLFAQVDNG